MNGIFIPFIVASRKPCGLCSAWCHCCSAFSFILLIWFGCCCCCCCVGFLLDQRLLLLGGGGHFGFSFSFSFCWHCDGTISPAHSSSHKIRLGALQICCRACVRACVCVCVRRVIFYTSHSSIFSLLKVNSDSRRPLLLTLGSSVEVSLAGIHTVSIPTVSESRSGALLCRGIHPCCTLGLCQLCCARKYARSSCSRAGW
jgi:hypothetical protein